MLSRIPVPFSSVFGDKRIALVFFLFLLFTAVFFLRLFYLQVYISDYYAYKAELSRQDGHTILAKRGTIYDRNGVVLAISVDAVDISANPKEIDDVEATAATLARILGGEVSDYIEKLSRTDTSFVYILRQADTDAAEQLKKLGLGGLSFTDTTRREYPNGSVGGQVIGYCDIDGNGICGLELEYDALLKGVDGYYSAEQSATGNPVVGGVVKDIPAVDGQDIMISLDIKLQESVENALAEGAADLETDQGCSVVMDASTGEIYAVCSLPYMDPSNMADSLIGSDNLTAVTQAFEPGSIFKTVSALTILENDVLTPDDELYCPSVITADGYEVSDAHSRESQMMTFREILDQSSNVGISLASEQMGFDKLYESILRFNFGKTTGIDFPGEAAGTIQDFDKWATITGYNVSFGQGITATPLQMVRFYGAIANGGVEVTPHFLLCFPQSGEWQEWETETVIDDEQALADIVGMLRTVVENGTGTAADIEGYEVVGKTSTAQIAENGEYLEGRYNLCFTGFIANSTSRLVCFVSAKEVYTGGSAAPIFKDIMTSAIEQYNIVPE